jgi:hypothetical protein
MEMEEVLKYRGRSITTGDVEFITDLIGEHPDDSRRALSKKLCEAWNWVQSNGSLRDMVCRSMMLELHRGGHIELPPVRGVKPNPLARRKKPAPVEVDQTPLRTSLAELGPLQIAQVRRTDAEPLVNGLIETHHYLGYTQPVGEHLKFLVEAQDRPIACFTWSSAPRHLAPRDRFIGWSAEARKRNIRFVAYNSRFLIMPWVEVPHLASHLLGRMCRMLPREWDRVYSHPVHFAETFVYPARFRGTCYRAANWVFMGQTTGRGKASNSYVPNRPLKDVLGYPLTRRFRQLLGDVG